MHCEICDFSNTGISDYAGQVYHSYNKKVRFHPRLKKWLCTDCIHIGTQILRVYEDDEVHQVVEELIVVSSE